MIIINGMRRVVQQILSKQRSLYSILKSGDKKIILNSQCPRVKLSALNAHILAKLSEIQISGKLPDIFPQVNEAASWKLDY